MNYERQIIELIESDKLRMQILRTVKSLGLPDCLVAAGFVRNVIWDSLFEIHSDLNDIDVIYYSLSDCTKERDLSLQQQLQSLEPELPWSVKNQARMHIKNGDPPYKDTMDAMEHWPEKQTAIGVMLDHSNRIVLRSGFDLDLQFNGQINHNPARSAEVFNTRVARKGWLTTWPKLQAQI